MIKSIAATVMCATLALACDKASDEQAKANGARAAADDKIGAVTKEADQKVKSVREEEEKKVAEAQAGFSKLREDYRHSTTTNLVELDSKVVDLEAKAKASSGKARTDLDASLKQIHSDRRTFDVDYKALETATAVTWDDARAHLDTEWTHLKTLVDKA